MLYSLDEICLIPSKLSQVYSRSHVNILTDNQRYPIFVAPMASLIDQGNCDEFKNKGFNVVIPRSVNWSTRIAKMKQGYWIAVGFHEAKMLYNYISDETGAGTFNYITKICIDQAHGHLDSLLKLCKCFKDSFGAGVCIMTGNIANPETYQEYAKCGVDYIRVGIGGGNVCTTSVQTGQHYPLGSLIIECNKQRNQVLENTKLGVKYLSIPKIVADGGFKRIDQCVKAIALGADYIMLGEIIAKSKEACGEEYIKDESTGKFYPISLIQISKDINVSDRLYREYFGMSTEKAQYLVHEASGYESDEFEIKHSEGQHKFVHIDYPISEWVMDFEHALRSSMSYSNAKNLDEFIGKVKFDYMTPVTYNAYMK